MDTALRIALILAAFVVLAVLLGVSLPELNLAIFTMPTHNKLSARAVTVIRSFLVWLITGAFAAALPLIAVAILRSHAGYPHDIHTILGTGDLILIAIILMIGAVGDFALALWEGRKANGLDILVLIGVPVGSLVAVLIYSMNAELVPPPQAYKGDPHGTVTASYWTYGAALAVGWSNIWRKSQGV